MTSNNKPGSDPKIGEELRPFKPGLDPIPGLDQKPGLDPHPGLDPAPEPSPSMRLNVREKDSLSDVGPAAHAWVPSEG